MTAQSDISMSAAARLMVNGNYGLAIETYRRILAADPEDATAVEGLATAYDRLQRYDLSDRYFQQALALAPRNSDIYRAYAASLKRQGRDEDAALLDVDMRAMQASASSAETQGVQPASDRGAVATSSPAVMTVPPPAVVAAQPVLFAIPLTPSAGQSVVLEIPPAAPRAAKLERTSSAEVRLVLPATVDTSSLGTRTNSARPTASETPSVLPTRVLNAAGSRGTARRVRSFLTARGWSALDVGDSSARLAGSRIVFPVGSGDEARRIARALPFRTKLYPLLRANRIQLLVGGNAVSTGARLKRQS
jgi:hypothetical protein